MFENEPDLLTRKQAQNLLSVGKNTILKLISDGCLPAVMIAGSYRIKKSDLIDFVEKTSALYC
ncbi:MAG: helix-turn-helix domain-containing protein [bacterium]|nr:helix-turn-helix domain-containing protein [bacterium]